MVRKWAAASAAFPLALLGWFFLPSFTGTAGASPPMPCQETSEQLPLGLAHGNPQTGLQANPGANDYYYLFVSPAKQCPAGKTVNLVSTLTTGNQLKAVGALPGTPVSFSFQQTWWFVFHSGTGATGFSESLDNSKYVTESGGSRTTCHPVTHGVAATCLVATGAHPITLTYNGPNVFKGSYGVRITNMDTGGQIMTDHSVLTLVN